MKKATKIVLIIATALVVVGGAMSFGALAAVQFNFKALSTSSDLVNQSYVSERGDYQSIKINGLGENYSIIRGAGEAVEVDYYSSDALEYTFNDEGDTLIIEEKNHPRFMFFNFDTSFYDRNVVIKVPASFTGDIEVGGANSNISVQGIEARSLVVQTAGGDVSVEDMKLAGACSIDCTSGSVKFTSLSVHSLTVNGMSSDVAGKGILAEDKVECAVASGYISLRDAQANAAVLSAASGDINVESLRSSSAIINTMSGSITSSALAAEQIEMKAASGDIRAGVEGDQSEYRIVAKAVSGDVDVPLGNDNSPNSISLEATSGDINLGFSLRG
ncbi:MAG: DUF4097 family beta strand repeat-containing protein [Raoultibacter sp.]|jgi:DUF4097 and DUF4098 domain-containing protein YvlB